LFSVVKTIAAFCNSRGGTLLVGVEDNGDIAGVQDDFPLLKKPEQEFDAWELQLRSSVEEHFLDGKAINSYIALQKIVVGEKTIITPAARDLGEENRVFIQAGWPR
jgi:predicted HTH transcriptional regulator